MKKEIRRKHYYGLTHRSWEIFQRGYLLKRPKHTHSMGMCIRSIEYSNVCYIIWAVITGFKNHVSPGWGLVYFQNRKPRGFTYLLGWNYAPIINN